MIFEVCNAKSKEDWQLYEQHVVCHLWKLDSMLWLILKRNLMSFTWRLLQTLSYKHYINKKRSKSAQNIKITCKFDWVCLMMITVKQRMVIKEIRMKRSNVSLMRANSSIEFGKVFLFCFTLQTHKHKWEKRWTSPGKRDKINQ